MKPPIKLEFPRDINPKYILTAVGAKIIGRENLPFVVNERAGFEGSAVYIFSPRGKNFFLKNPYNRLHPNLPPTAIFYRLNCYDYDRLCEEYNIKTKTRSDWFQTAIAFGIGDALWQAICFLFLESPTLTNDANFFLPLLIGPITGVVNYYLQKKQFERKYNRSPSSSESAQLKMDSAGLTIKMTLGILGWEAGLWISTSALSNVKSHRALYVFLTGLFTGFGQSLGVVSATITDEIRKTGATFSSKVEMAGLLFASTLCGAMWYYLSAIDYAPGLENFSKDAVSALVGGICTFLTITGIFSLMSPKDSYRSFRFCTHQLFSSSPTETRDTGLRPPMSRERYNQTRVFI